jgi:hypothetical protein
MWMISFQIEIEHFLFTSILISLIPNQVQREERPPKITGVCKQHCLISLIAKNIAQAEIIVLPNEYTIMERQEVSDNYR